MVRQWDKYPLVRLVALDHADGTRTPAVIAVVGWLVETTPQTYVLAYWLGEESDESFDEFAVIIRSAVLELTYLDLRP